MRHKRNEALQPGGLLRLQSPTRSTSSATATKCTVSMVAVALVQRASETHLRMAARVAVPAPCVTATVMLHTRLVVVLSVVCVFGVVVLLSLASSSLSLSHQNFCDLPIDRRTPTTSTRRPSSTRPPRESRREQSNNCKESHQVGSSCHQASDVRL